MWQYSQSAAMKTTLLMLAALFGFSASAQVLDINQVKERHLSWMKEHGKTYATPAEEDHRFGIFERNLEMILEHNIRHTLGETSFTMDLNLHADLTLDEWRTNLSFKPRDTPRDHSVPHSTHMAPLIRGAVDVPATVDWNAAGAVTPVKDQGQCGSCWSFSSTGAMEGAHFIATKSLVSLSEEQLIYCVNGGAFDCSSGGDMPQAFEYVISNGGIVAESKLPYATKDHGKCTFKKGASGYAATFSSYKSVTSNDENALKTAVAQQPVAIAIDAGQQSFQFYSSGVYDEPACCTNCQQSDLDHGVLAVGYGTEDGKDYWLVKNSWNGSWGDNGFIKMVRNDKSRCGVATYASYPVV